MALGAAPSTIENNDCELGREVWPASDGNSVLCLLNFLG